jgi:excinuclease UvrABC nuclease subunit
MTIEETEIVETYDYKIIIYPASRSFLAREAKEISEKLFDFLATWKAHGKPLTSSFKIEKNQFVIISVDEEKESASGCSMDELNGVFRELEEKFNLGFFERMKTCYQENGEVKTLKLQDFKTLIKTKEIPENIEVFDFSKSTYTDFLATFILPLKDSWAGRL